jgi:hypothetical protein
MRQASWVPFVLFAMIVGACCGSTPAPDVPSPWTKNSIIVAQENGLSRADRSALWHMDEGIHYLPYGVIASLKRPLDSGVGLYDELFLARPERLGLLPDPHDASAPPVGITISQDPDFVPMAGINCATCHTSAVSSRSQDGSLTTFYIDGGSSQFAIDRLIQSMVFSVAYTLICPTEFSGFYKRYRARTDGVAGSSDMSPVGLRQFVDGDDFGSMGDAVRRAVDGDLSDLRMAINSRGTQLPGGARTSLNSWAYPTEDELSTAPGMYFYLARRLVFFLEKAQYASTPGVDGTESGLGRSNPWSVTKNMIADGMFHEGKDSWSKEVGGPINTPFIWDFERQKWIFWTGVTNSMLERNMAQGIALVTDFNWTTKETTISVKKLEAVSALVRKAKAPKWPEEILGSIDHDLAEAGKEVFRKNCLGCHDPMMGSSSPGSAEYHFYDVGTDPEYFNGQVAPFLGKDLFSSALEPFLEDVKAASFKREGVSDPEALQIGRLPSIWKAPTKNAFAAKPLYGVWATGPFLHNGSVRTVRQLLTAPKDREKEFWVGSTILDVKNLGFLDEQMWFGSKVVTSCEKGCRGNSASGHDFGTGLSNPEKDQIIEFLKSYGPDTKFD